MFHESVQSSDYDLNVFRFSSSSSLCLKNVCQTFCCCSCSKTFHLREPLVWMNVEDERTKIAFILMYFYLFIVLISVTSPHCDVLNAVWLTWNQLQVVVFFLHCFMFSASNKIIISHVLHVLCSLVNIYLLQ